MKKKTQQIYLQRLGYYCDLIDGKKGSKHIAALKAFQKDHSLKVTGNCNSTTEQRLKKAYKKRDKSKLSKHFKLSEFRCGDGCGAPDVMNAKLIGILEKLRVTYNKPITVTSGYRCKSYNARLAGSVSNSAHCKKKAADIYIPGASLSGIKSKAYAYGATYCYYGTANMGNAIHINV